MKTHAVDVSGGTLRLECFGVLDAPQVRTILDELKKVLSSQSVARVLVVTSKVSDCVEAGKKELVSLQRELAAGRRTAWVDERARFRGIALWVMHLAEDSNSKAVSSLAQAEAWLNSTEIREARGQKLVGS